MRRLAIALVAAQAALAGCNSGSSRQLHPAMRIDGLRTEGERGLVLTFVGGSPSLEPSDPCWVGYRPEVEETTTRVVVTIRTQPSRVPLAQDRGCTMEGYFRTLQVELRRALRGRQVVDGATGLERRPFDSRTLLHPRFLPDGWALRSEGPGFDEPEPSATWRRTWGPPPVPPRDGRCADTVSPVTVSQGPPGPGAGTGGVAVDVRGVPGTVRDEPGGQVRLQWQEQGQLLELVSSPPCAGTPPAPVDLLLRIAHGLAPE